MVPISSGKQLANLGSLIEAFLSYLEKSCHYSYHALRHHHIGIDIRTEKTNVIYSIAYSKHKTLTIVLLNLIRIAFYN